MEISVNEKTIHTEEPSASGLASDEAFFSNVCACVAGMFERLKELHSFNY